MMWRRRSASGGAHKSGLAALGALLLWGALAARAQVAAPPPPPPDALFLVGGEEYTGNGTGNTTFDLCGLYPLHPFCLREERLERADRNPGPKPKDQPRARFSPMRNMFRHDIDPTPKLPEYRWLYVQNVYSYSPNKAYFENDALYIAVKFSEKIYVNTSEGWPYLLLSTGRHFEEGAAGANATFLAGGVTTSKAFWMNDEPNPLKSLLPAPCRSGTEYNRNFSLVSSHLLNLDFCHLEVPEDRVEESASDLMIFAYRVGLGERTSRLDLPPFGALQLNGASIEHVRAGYKVTNNFTYNCELDYLGNLCNQTLFFDTEVGQDLQLPTPGDEMRGAAGAPQSLSVANRIVVGGPYVLNVSLDVPDGKYGMRKQGSIADGGGYLVPDEMYLHVQMSEPVKVACPEWLEGAGLRSGHRTCRHVQVLLDTGPVTVDSSSGSPGQEVYPTGYLYDGGWGLFNASGYFPGHTLVFQYSVRRWDRVAYLDFIDRESLKVWAGASITRTYDAAAAGLRLPPANHSASISYRRVEIDAGRLGGAGNTTYPPSQVSFVLSFANLTVADFSDTTFSYNFQVAFKSRVAGAADVGEHNVDIISIHAGSVLVTATVTFPGALTAPLTFKSDKQRFIDILRRDPHSIFRDDADANAWGPVTLHEGDIDDVPVPDLVDLQLFEAPSAAACAASSACPEVALDPAFDSGVHSYSAAVGHLVDAVVVVAQVRSPPTPRCTDKLDDHWGWGGWRSTPPDAGAGSRKG